MRNLNIVRKYEHPNIIPNVENVSKLVVICRGDDSHIYICDTKASKLFKVDSDGIQKPVECGNEEILSNVFQIQFVSSTSCIFLATTDGAFIQVNDSSYTEVQELFRSEEGIAKFAVSSDSRLVAILTKKKTLLLLTLPDLECIAQNLLSEVNEEQDFEFASICWRADSHYFAVNYPKGSNAEKSWQIKIYDENGSLYSTSTTEGLVNLLNQSLEWQPSGGLIAAYGKSPHSNAIVLFELNGLERAHFATEDSNEVLGISWNCGSDVLAIRYKTSVELWTRNNYVWMQKKILQASISGNETFPNVVFSQWDSELAYRIHVVYGNGCYGVYDLALSYSNGLSCGSALTASWNGRNVYCTPFRDNCAPPPYGYMQAKIDDYIKSTIVSNFWDGLLCITYSGKFIFLKNDKTSLSEMKTYNYPDTKVTDTLDNVIWPNKSQLCCAYNGVVAVFDLPDEFEATDKTEELQLIKKINHITVEGQSICRVLPIVSGYKESNLVLAETTNNTILVVNSITQFSTKVCKLPHVFANIRSIILPNESVILFAHDPISRKLLAGWSKYPDSEPIKLSTDCSSLATFCENLLLTTSQGSLEILNIDFIVDTFEQSFSGKEIDSLKLAEGRFSRKIEKGSQIVTCCVNQMLEPSLILQIIPRGNFETISPRPLLISTLRVTLREYENQTRYEKIMNALRRHRLDYRVLIDEMKHLEKDTGITLETSLRHMVDQVKDSHSLVLLVTDLDDDYADCIKIIKDLLGKSMELDTEKGLKRNIEEAYLASLAKLGLLEEALKSQLIEGELKEHRNFVTHRVKFLSYYCDNPDTLFDTAIGTYDLGLASLVADCLGKDPKEYLPILEEFQALPEGERKFKIDDKLRRYSKAVINMIQDQTAQHDKILKYMERHRLFTDALEFLNFILKNTSNSELVGSNRTQEDISSLLHQSKSAYGKYLEEHGKLKEACILYRGGQQYPNAIECAIKSGSWETALEISYSQKFSPEQIDSLCSKILESLEENKNYSGAARLCEVHMKNISKAVEYWIRDRRWLRARSLAYQSQDLGEKFINERLFPKLMEAATEQIEYLKNLTTEISQKRNRWHTVKAIKAKKLLEYGQDGEGDSFSDTDSVSTGSGSTKSSRGSTSSGRSSRSSKSKRKFERKLNAMKEGSQYEDLGIAVHLWNTFENVQQEVKPDITEVVDALWNFELNDLAINVGSIFDSLLLEISRTIQDIWATVLMDELLDMKYRLPPVGWSTSWDKLCLHEPSSKAVSSGKPLDIKGSH